MKRFHCWHFDSVLNRSIDGRTMQICCQCGAHRTATEEKEHWHGPFLPKVCGAGIRYSWTVADHECLDIEGANDGCTVQAGQSEGRGQSNDGVSLERGSSGADSDGDRSGTS